MLLVSRDDQVALLLLGSLCALGLFVFPFNWSGLSYFLAFEVMGSLGILTHIETCSLDMHFRRQI